MNLGLIQRAIRRHTLMKDRPAYTALLEHVRVHGNVWAVSQREVARWWEQRQQASVQLRRIDGGRLAVECALAEAAVEVDSARVLVPPFELPVARPSAAAPSYDPRVADEPLLREILGHLGYGHVRCAAPGATPVLPAARLDPLLTALRESATRHQRFDEEPLSRMRGLLAEGHRRCGLPDLRLWPLPQRGGRPYAVALSVRYDVDAAIQNMAGIHALEDRYGVRSTAYLRPLGYFYGAAELRAYARVVGGHELALHGEFVTSAERRFGSELRAAAGEKALLEELVGAEASGICMHGGELRTNTTPNTWRAVEQAGFRYDTMYRNRYYHPLHLPGDGALRRTLSIGQHFADISVALGPDFAEELAAAFIEQLHRAEEVAGVFVPVMHPLYFDVAAYLRHPRNGLRLAAFVPRFLATVARMRRDQLYSNR
jgi:hypothetical protein